MNRRSPFPRILTPALVVLSLLAAPIALAAEPPPAAEPEAQAQPLVVFLVRHAEKVDASKDPELSPAGTERAADLALVLRDAGIEHVLSSDYIRTRNTAGPIAAELKLEVELYDPRDLPALADKLKAASSRYLVVGHSNTTPEVVGLLGGDPGAEIDEDVEYDRLYVVTIGPDGAVSTVLMRYGNAP